MFLFSLYMFKTQQKIGIPQVSHSSDHPQGSWTFSSPCTHGNCVYWDFWEPDHTEAYLYLHIHISSKKKGRYFIQIFPAFSVNLQMQSNQCTFGIIQIEAHNPNPVWHMRFWSLDKQKLRSWTAPFLSHSWTSVLFMGFHYLINTISYMCRTSMKWLPLILYEQRKQPERDKQLVVWCCLPTNRDRKFKRTSIPWFLSNHVQGWKQNRRITSATNRFVIQSCLAMVHSWWLHYTVTKWIVKRSWLTKS